MTSIEYNTLAPLLSIRGSAKLHLNCNDIEDNFTIKHKGKFIIDIYHVNYFYHILLIVAFNGNTDIF